MLYSAQRVITALSERIDLGDESVYLRGAASQAMTIDGSGAGAASPGASFRLINDSDHDATFTPGTPQAGPGIVGRPGAHRRHLGAGPRRQLDQGLARRARPVMHSTSRYHPSMTTRYRLFLALVVMFLALLVPACDGCFDCKQCPSICAGGSSCVETYLMSEDRKAWVCRELPGRPQLTSIDAGICDAGSAGVCQ